MSKELPPPGGGWDVEGMLRRRRINADKKAAAPEQPEQPKRADAPVRAGGMDRRSWYMAKQTADALAAVVEDLHFATRKPKHVVLSELVAVALEHQAEVERRLLGE